MPPSPLNSHLQSLDIEASLKGDLQIPYKIDRAEEAVGIIDIMCQTGLELKFCFTPNSCVN